MDFLRGRSAPAGCLALLLLAACSRAPAAELDDGVDLPRLPEAVLPISAPMTPAPELEAGVGLPEAVVPAAAPAGGAEIPESPAAAQAVPEPAQMPAAAQPPAAAQERGLAGVRAALTVMTRRLTGLPGSRRLAALMDGSRPGGSNSLPAVAMPERAQFPKKFLWGVATAAYQIEGNNKNSDLWDWERKKGWERSGQAVDSWNMMDEDVRRLKELGVNAYRFSMEWGRIMPERGRVDEAALARYSRLLDLLKAAGIAPIVTIHHFTNPVWFWERHPKGWSDPAAVGDYLDFVRLLAGRFAGRVDAWVTFNEPVGYLMNGFVSGYFPPGKRISTISVPPDFMPGVKTIAVAHRAAYRILHAADPRPEVKVGLVQNPSPVEPWKDTPLHRAAAARWDHFFHWNLLDGAAKGRLDMSLQGKPDTVLDDGRPALDFVGLNYYTRVVVRHFPVMRPVDALAFYAEVRESWLGKLLFWLAGGRFGPGPKDDIGHEVYPEGLKIVSRTAWRRYGLPIMITENGLADSRDSMRSAFLAAHLQALKAALDQGIEIIGYLHWSLMDNYEWGSFKPRFGLYRVDRADGFRRVPTEGSRAYARFLKGKKP